MSTIHRSLSRHRSFRRVESQVKETETCTEKLIYACTLTCCTVCLSISVISLIVFIAVCTAFLNVFAVIAIAFGAIHLNECPVNPGIPIVMIVFGVVSFLIVYIEIVDLAFKRYKADEATEKKDDKDQLDGIVDVELGKVQDVDPGTAGVEGSHSVGEVRGGFILPAAPGAEALQQEQPIDQPAPEAAADDQLKEPDPVATKSTLITHFNLFLKISAVVILIYAAVLVYEVYPVEFVRSSPNYCHPKLYNYSFCLITALLVIGGIVLPILCCCCCLMALGD